MITRLLSVLLTLTCIQGWAQEFNWAHSNAALTGEFSRAGNNTQTIKIDDKGNAIVGGWFTDTLKFPSHPNIAPLILPNGKYAAYVAKYNRYGDLLWAKLIDNSSANSGYGKYLQVAVDETSNIYLTSWFMDTFKYEVNGVEKVITSNNRSRDILIMKINPDGESVWATSAGGTANDAGNGICYDGMGNIYVTGQYSNKAIFNPGDNEVSITSVDMTPDIFIVKYDTSGNFVWVKSVGGPHWNDEGRSVGTDKYGNVYVSGIFGGSVDYNNAGDFDPGVGVYHLSSSSLFGHNTFILKLRSNGDFVWAKALNSTMDAHPNDMAVSKEGSVHVTGHYRTLPGIGDEKTDFDPGTGVYDLGSTSYRSYSFIAKLDSAGLFAWAKRIWSPRGSWGTGISVDTNENVYTLGTAGDSTIFNTDSSATILYSDTVGLFVHKMDAKGNFKWVKNISGSFSSSSMSTSFIDVDASGRNIWLANMIQSGHTIDADPDTSIYELKNENDGYFISVGFIAKWGCMEVALEENVSIEGLDSVCLGETYTYKSLVPYALSYKWILPEGAIASSITDSVIEVTFTQDSDLNLSVIVYGKCDSIELSKNLELSIPRVFINVDEFVLGTTYNGYESWQWYVNGEKIPGATDSVYTVTQNGLHKVVVTGKGCTDSNTYNVTNVGIEQHFLYDQVSIYPNPTNSNIYITSPENVNIQITGLEGKQLLHTRSAKEINLNQFPSGIYMLTILDKNDVPIKREKIIKY